MRWMDGWTYRVLERSLEGAESVLKEGSDVGKVGVGRVLQQLHDGHIARVSKALLIPVWPLRRL